MNINFNNNIDIEKNPTFIVISSPSDLINVNKFPNLLKKIVINLKKVKNISSILDRNKILKLAIPSNNSLNEIIIYMVIVINTYSRIIYIQM